MTRLTAFARELLIEAAVEFTPEWGRQHVRPAFAGDQQAAQGLAFALHDRQRAGMAHAMYRARVKPAAFREVLEDAMTQSHEYGSVLRLARGRRGLMRWLRYAGFDAPPGLAETVTIYRGVAGCSPDQGLKGLSWTLDFNVAAYFAARFPTRGLPLVLKADVIRMSLMSFAYEGAPEKEIIPAVVPEAYEVINDMERIRIGMECFSRKSNAKIPSDQASPGPRAR